MTFVDYPITHWARIGSVVRESRRNVGMTQEALAERAGVSRGWLVRLERGLDNPEAAPLMRVLRALDIELIARPVQRTQEQLIDEAFLTEILGDD